MLYLSDFVVDSILDRGHASVAGVALQLNVQPRRKRHFSCRSASNFERVTLVHYSITLGDMENGRILANEILFNIVFAVDCKSPTQDKLLLSSTLVLQFYFITTLVCETFLVVLKSSLISNGFNRQLLDVAQSCLVKLGCHHS